MGANSSANEGPYLRLARITKSFGRFQALHGIDLAIERGELVTFLQEAGIAGAGVVINAGAYTHTSVAILDALNAFDGPVIEVHISNVHKRESFRHHSYVSLRADGVIAGCGTEGYLLALRRVVSLLAG